MQITLYLSEHKHPVENVLSIFLGDVFFSISIPYNFIYITFPFTHHSIVTRVIIQDMLRVLHSLLSLFMKSPIPNTNKL